MIAAIARAGAGRTVLIATHSQALAAGGGQGGRDGLSGMTPRLDAALRRGGGRRGP